MHRRELDPGAVVGFFPSDHYFADDDAFVAHVESAFRAAESGLRQVVLLGIVPNGPEVDYGWIEPGVPLLTRASNSVFRVRRFWDEAFSRSRLRATAARLALEQLRHGWSRGFVPEFDPESFAESDPTLRVNSFSSSHTAGGISPHGSLRRYSHQ